MCWYREWKSYDGKVADSGNPRPKGMACTQGHGETGHQLLSKGLCISRGLKAGRLGQQKTTKHDWDNVETHGTREKSWIRAVFGYFWGVRGAYYGIGFREKQGMMCIWVRYNKRSKPEGQLVSQQRRLSLRTYIRRLTLDVRHHHGALVLVVA